MLTGNLPMTGDDMKTLVNWHLNEDIRDTHNSLPDLPEEMHEFFMRSVRRDPLERFHTVSEVIGLLKPLSEKCGIVAEPHFCVQQKMIGMFLSYQEDQQLPIKRLIEDFYRNISEAGAVLKITQFED
jgi:hypothetical protein